MSETLKSKIEYFQNWQTKLLEQNNALENEKQKYRAEMKAAFGLADGEPANVLEIVEAIERIKHMA